MNHEPTRPGPLSFIGIAAMVVACLLVFAVLSDTDMASKFENRIAAVGGVVAAGCAWVALSRVAWSCQ